MFGAVRGLGLSLCEKAFGLFHVFDVVLEAIVQEQERPRIACEAVAEAAAFRQQAFFPDSLCGELSCLVPFRLPEAGGEVCIFPGGCKEEQDSRSTMANLDQRGTSCGRAGRHRRGKVTVICDANPAKARDRVRYQGHVFTRGAIIKLLHLALEQNSQDAGLKLM